MLKRRRTRRINSNSNSTTTAATFKKVTASQNDFAQKSEQPIDETVSDLKQIGYDAEQLQDVSASPTFMAFNPKEGSPSVRNSRFLMAVGKEALQLGTKLNQF